jgi:hypothetical protein
MAINRIKFLPPREGHGETGACVCHVCSSNMRLIGIEPHPRQAVGADLFTYECTCGELHTDSLCLHPIAGEGLGVEFLARSRFE